MYYRDAEDLTAVGFQQGNESYGTTTALRTYLWPDPDNPRKVSSGTHLSRFHVGYNGGRLDARGLEFTVETHFLRWARVQLVYDLAYSAVGRYGPTSLYVPTEFSGETKKGIDNYYGGDNNNNERWSPNNTIRVNAGLNSPVTFGPAIGSFYLLGDWDLSVYYQWNSGHRFTYERRGDVLLLCNVSRHNETLKNQ